MTLAAAAICGHEMKDANGIRRDSLGRVWTRAESQAPSSPHCGRTRLGPSDTPNREVLNTRHYSTMAEVMGVQDSAVKVWSLCSGRSAVA